MRAFMQTPLEATTIEVAEPATRQLGFNGRPQGRGGPLLGDKIDLKLLIIAAEEDDPNLTAITDLLTRLGSRFDVMIASRESLTPERLWYRSHANYQGVVLATGSLSRYRSGGNQWESALGDDEWQTLRRFEARFGIRQVVLQTRGGADQEIWGLRFSEALDTVLAPVTVTLTEAGSRVFWYLNETSPISLRNVWVGLAKAIDELTVPLLVTPEGLIVGAIRRSSDGRECLSLTMSHGADLTHTLLLGYGLVNWVTRGVFVGARRTYLSLQVDDIFSATRLWDPERESGEDGRICRLTGKDVEAFLDWLDGLRLREPNAANTELDLAYNGGGVALFSWDDTLVPALMQHQTRFRWINHTFSHQLLSEADFDTGLREIELNQAMAQNLGLKRHHTDCLITPALSGLGNTEFLRAARDAEVRYLVSDTSQAGWGNPSFNVGIVSAMQPEILIIPRHPTNLFYNLSTPDEWVAEYNYIYRTLWRRDLAYQEILEAEAEIILQYLLKFDIDPLMFHQANLASYDGTHSLLSDLIEGVLAKYSALYGTVPICCLGMHEIGEAMAARAVFDGAEIQASLIRGRGLVLTSDRDVVVPITGIQAGETIERYASQYLSAVRLRAHQPRKIPVSKLTDYAPVDDTENGVEDE
jgi:hypothetical protein